MKTPPKILKNIHPTINTNSPTLFHGKAIQLNEKVIRIHGEYEQSIKITNPAISVT